MKYLHKILFWSKFNINFIILFTINLFFINFTNFIKENIINKKNTKNIMNSTKEAFKKSKKKFLSI